MSFKESFVKKQELLLKYAPSCVIVFCFCYFLAPSSKMLNNSYYVLVLAPTLFLINKIGFTKLLKSFHFKVFTAFCTWMAVSVAWADNKKFSEVKYVLYVFIFTLAVSWTYKNRHQISEKLIYPFIAITAIIPLIIFYVSKYVRNEPRLKLKDAHGMFETALTGGNTLCFFMIVSVALFFHFKKKNIRVLLVISLASMSILLLYTRSRSSLLAAMAGLATFFLVKYASKKVLIISGVSVIVSALILMLFLHSKNWFRLPTPKQGHLEYTIQTEGAEQIKLTKKLIEDQKWDGVFEEISVNGENVDFDDGDEIAIPVSQSLNTLTLVSPDTGFHPFNCFDLSIVKSNGDLQPISIEPPRMLYIDLSLNIRTTTWSLFIDEIRESPVVGHGLSQRIKVYIPERDIYYKDTHNMMIGTTMRGGLIALLLWLVFIIYAFVVLFNTRNYLLFSLLTSGFVFTLFDDDNFFKAPLPYWLCMLIPLACSFVIDAQRSSKGNDVEVSLEDDPKLNDTICVPNNTPL